MKRRDEDELTPDQLFARVRHLSGHPGRPQVVRHAFNEPVCEYLNIPSSVPHDISWVGNGAMFAQPRLLYILLKRERRRYRLVPRTREKELRRQDEAIARALADFFSDRHAADKPAFLWLHTRVYSQPFGMARYGAAVQVTRRTLSDGVPLKSRVRMFFDPLRSMNLETADLAWHDAPLLPDDVRHLVKIRRSRKVDGAGTAHAAYQEQLGIARRSRRFDPMMFTGLMPSEAELCHDATLESNGRIRFAPTRFRLDGITQPEPPPGYFARAVYDCLMVTGWRLRQRVTGCETVRVRMDELAFFLDRHSGRVTTVASGSDAFRAGDREPMTTAWGTWLADHL